jgi:hypothetical protein
VTDLESSRVVVCSPTRLGREQALADIASLAREIAHRYSYFPLRADGFARGLDAARERLTDSLTIDDFALMIMTILASLADGHTRLTGAPEAYAPQEYAPALFGVVEGRIVALGVHGTTFLEPKLPFLRAIDGVQVDEWVKAASVITPSGPPQYLALHSARTLRYVGLLRRILGMPRSASVEVELTDATGSAAKTLQLQLSDRKPLYSSRANGGQFPAAILGSGIGYLRIERMEDERVAGSLLRARFRELQDTPALVLDLRDNGGGSRDLVTLMVAHLACGDASPVVANVAAYRRREVEMVDPAEGFLGDRDLYPLTSARWTLEERRSIERFAEAFRPEWLPPRDIYSDWHYMVVSRAQGHAAYDKPVVVLANAGSFSATEVLLAALKGRPRITIVGSPSGGGSGRARGFTLPTSGLRIKASTMVSYGPDGKLIQGRGVVPDVELSATEDDWIGRRDTALDCALSLLQ